MAGNSTNQRRMDAGDGFYGRRDSVAVAGNEFQLELVQKLGELREIWDEVGMTEEQRRERMATALTHLKNLLAEMVEEESCMRETLHNSLIVSKREIDVLLNQLRRQKPEFLRDGRPQLTLLELNEQCSALKTELEEERDSRIRERDALLREYSQFTTRLDIPAHKFDQSTIPDKAALETLADDVDRVKKLWDSNLAVFHERHARILNLSAKISLEHICLSDFQRQLLNGDSKRGQSLVLSVKNMEDVFDLDNLIQDKYNAYLEEVRERIAVVQLELTKWWDQCHVPAAERERFQTVDPESNPERAVEQYNEAISYWSAFYESRKTILDKIGEWERLWQEHVEFEEREQDPNRYKNRGGALLQEEKRRKKVQGLLPQTSKQLQAMVADYDHGHPDSPFLMDGIGVMAYIDSIQDEYQEKKRKEKEDKEMQKKQQLMVERMYGAVPNTPGSQRKRVGVAASVTPNKQMTSPGKKAPATAGSKVYVHSSLAARSPIANKTNNPQSGPGSSSKKPPTGVPIRAQTVKRKVLMEHQGDQDLQQPSTSDNGHSEDRASVLSTGSYGEFAKILRGRGVEVQSSFIGGQTHSPSKMARKD